MSSPQLFAESSWAPDVLQGAVCYTTLYSIHRPRNSVKTVSFLLCQPGRKRKIAKPESFRKMSHLKFTLFHIFLSKVFPTNENL